MKYKNKQIDNKKGKDEKLERELEEVEVDSTKGGELNRIPSGNRET